MTRAEDESSPGPTGDRRWVIVGLLFLGTLVCYFDRVALPAVAPDLRREIALSNVQFSWVFNAFLIVYAVSMAFWGGLFDRIGNRAGFTVAVLVWSVAEVGTGLVRGIGGLCGTRALLGLGEAGNWPGATRTLATWLPPERRALGMGIANAGASLGPAIGIPLVLWLSGLAGWRGTFVITGAMGGLWLVLWLALYPRGNRGAPEARGLVRGAAHGVAHGAVHGAASGDRPAAPSWPALLRSREVRGIVLARLLGDPIWWLYVNWMPLYLADARGLRAAELQAKAWIPYAFAGLGAVSGGWLSGLLLGWTGDPGRARKTAIAIGAVAMLAGFAITSATSTASAIAWMSVTLFGFQFWVSNVQTLPSDYFPAEAVGSIAGLSGSAAGLGAVLFTFATGWVVDHFSYAPILTAAGILAPLATAPVFLLCGRTKKAGAQPED